MAIDELEAAFRASAGDLANLRRIRDALLNRKTHRARELLNDVNAALLRQDQGATPACPSCNGPMRLRTARKGKHAGQQFWGCASYPQCEGTRELPGAKLSGESACSESSISGAEMRPDAAYQQGAGHSLPVRWSDAATRANWIGEYVQIGAIPGLVRGHLDWSDGVVRRCLGGTVILTRRNKARRASESTRIASAVLVKLLQRGHLPLATLKMEARAIEDNLLQHCCDDSLKEDGECGWRLLPTRGHLSRGELLRAACERAPLQLDGEIEGGGDGLFGSPQEAVFLKELVPRVLGPEAAQWFIPQASLDRLVEGRGLHFEGDRRVDFLFSHPGGEAFVVEIDGPEHAGEVADDRKRDDDLARAGFGVLRVPNEEIDRGEGEALSEVFRRCKSALDYVAREQLHSPDLAAAVLDCAEGAKVQFAVARAIASGWLDPGDGWCIKLDGTHATSAVAVIELCEAVECLDRLYGLGSAPRSLELWLNGTFFGSFASKTAGDWTEQSRQNSTGSALRVLCERNRGPYDEVADQGYDIVIRSAYLPINLAVDHSVGVGRKRSSVPSIRDAQPALLYFLRQLFRKTEFREFQAEGVFNALRHIDTIVLLPTGAGKSIIYQLAGLLMPGVTLVVDPIISLIEDQVDGLAQYGIDRATPITSGLTTRQERAQLLQRIERGEFQFVLHSPERLQSPEFRQGLLALAESSLINLAVIDEAHCVSEWGHDFRPSYLNLARNLRRFGADKLGTPPPLLALTGTASRAVLRDVVVELGIDRSRSDSLIRPNSFNRPELTFSITRTSPTQGEQAVLRGILVALPAEFSIPREELYRHAGRHTYSGLIFVPFANGAIFGVTSVATQVRIATSSQVGIYSGTAPRGIDATAWGRTKRATAQSFKENKTPILVSTKAFGMGIDKPNIRYTIHFGLPGSLESFYQEVGRAGRDRRPAQCKLIFSEYDANRSDRLLDPDISLGELHTRYEEARRQRDLEDDVTRQLYFHVRAFAGADKERADVIKILEALPDLTRRDRVSLPFWPDEEDSKKQEKAILRLVQAGIFEDYEVDYGARHFVAHLQPFDLGRARNRILEYVQTSQPGRIRAVARELENIQDDQPRGAAVRLVDSLIAFTYDVIERARRRALQEAVQVARTAATDAAIRARLLDYLQEGIGTEQFEQLLRENVVRLEAWFAFIDKIQTAVDAGELRGLAIRALESYPDHPGLLLLRGVSESMCSDRTERVVAESLYASFNAALRRYDVQEGEVQKTVQVLSDLASAKATALAMPFTIALCRLNESSPNLTWLRDSIRSLVVESRSRGAMLATGIFELGRLVETVKATEHLARSRWLAIS